MSDIQIYDWSPQQSQALSLVSAWLKDPTGSQIFYLAGFAGTGKTTLAKHLVQNVGLFTFAAFTGKAASVLCRKGCPASTIHRLIYEVVPPNESLVRELRKEIEKELAPEKIAALRQELLAANRPRFNRKAKEDFPAYDVIVIDEVSMVDEVLGSDLLSFGCKVLVLGDPGQLPPVGGEGYFTSRDPDFCLTEIHRQAQGNPIINMATLVRKGRRLGPGSYGSSKVVPRYKQRDEDLLAASQVIVGRSATRRSYNDKIRDALNFTGAVPERGEKIICLKNDHEEELLNGTQWLVQESEDQGDFVELKIREWDSGFSSKAVQAHRFGQDFSEMPFYQRALAQEFDYGYAITCHKAQGSQWHSIYIQDESWIFRADSAKWLYTALTRAEESVTVVL